MRQQRHSRPEPRPIEAIEALLGDAVVGTETHCNAPAVVVRADRVVDALSTLRHDAGFDHCSCVTAQEYPDRYESIYHLTSYDDRTREVSVVVPVPRDDQTSESGAAVYRTSDWH